MCWLNGDNKEEQDCSNCCNDDYCKELAKN